MKIVISSGHGLRVAGAVGIINEATEARRVTDCVADILRSRIEGVDVNVFHENNAQNQSANVTAIVRHHNGQARDLDVSIHFNSVAGGIREEGIGVEVLYRDGDTKTRDLAARTSKAISAVSGLRDRGAKPRKNLGFLDNTTAPAIIIEVCFVNSRTDVSLYKLYFDKICRAIAESISGKAVAPPAAFPVSEENLRAMQKLGVMNSPEYWRNVTNAQWLNELLSKAARDGVLDSRIDNGITDIETALIVLRDAGIVNSPDYWRNLVNANTVPYLDVLLINIANRSRVVLEKIVYAEARGEDLHGQTLVANVVLNRHQSDAFPDGIYNVVTQSTVNSQGSRVFQFAPVGSGAYAAAVPSESARQAVTNALDGQDHSQNAMFFIGNSALEGSWHQSALTKLFSHGGHTFFR